MSSNFPKRNFDFFCEFSPLLEVKELLTLHVYGVESLQNYLVTPDKPTSLNME